MGLGYIEPVNYYTFVMEKNKYDNLWTGYFICKGMSCAVWWILRVQWFWLECSLGFSFLDVIYLWVIRSWPFEGTTFTQMLGSDCSLMEYHIPYEWTLKVEFVSDRMSLWMCWINSGIVTCKWIVVQIECKRYNCKLYIHCHFLFCYWWCWWTANFRHSNVPQTLLLQTVPTM
jgi:hypothetical protein